MQHSNQITQVLQYLIKHNLTMEEAGLLYSIYTRSEVPEDTQFLKLSQTYYRSQQYYDQLQNPTGIPWSQIIQKLERDGFLLTYPGHAIKGMDGNYKLNTAKMEVTDKFRATIINNNREQLWNYYVEEIYGPYIVVNGEKINTVLPDHGQSYDQLLELFWSRCNNGMNSAFEDLCRNTLDYFEAFSRNIKISRFLKDYEANMMALRAEQKGKGSTYTNTY